MKREHDLDVINEQLKKQKLIDNFTRHSTGHFTVTLTSSTGEYHQIIQFITKLYIAQSKTISDFNELELSYVDEDDNDETKQKVFYKLPLDRMITIKYNNDYVTSELTKISNDHGTQSRVTYLYGLKMTASSKEVLDALILDAAKTEDILKIYCYQADPGHWKRNGCVQNRSIESLVIDKKTKDELFEDIELFYSKESEKEYSFYGMPYKRSYLLHGLPGTGKSSLVSIIATKFKRNIYIICFDPQLTDSGLMSAMSGIPDNSILLLEDIDCVFQDRETAPTKSNVSYSALFNVLDGVSRVKGLLTIITTNYIKTLDSALIRPGRVDLMIEFGFISEQQLIDLLQIYKIDLQKKTINTIYSLCEQKKLVPAAISNFLFRNRKKNLLDSEFITLFKEYLKEINPESNRFKSTMHT